MMGEDKHKGYDVKVKEEETFFGEAWKGHLGDVRSHSVVGRGGALVSGRLFPGTDMIRGILDMARSHGIKTGVVVTAFGSLARARFSTGVRPTPAGGRMERIEPLELEGPVEILCAQGKFGLPEEGQPIVHFHGVLVTAEGEVKGGHFFPDGNPVLITFEVAIQEILGLEHVWHWDEESGIFLVYPEERSGS